MADKAITARDYAKREGAKDVRQRIQRLAIKNGMKVEFSTNNKPVKARLDFGRWIADCECGGAEAVDYADPVFYCASCGNVRSGGKLRPVIFPSDYKAIELEIMARPLKYRGNGDTINQQLKSIPRDMPRNWTPDKE